MMDGFVKVYNQESALQAVLENAGDISYTLQHNDLWTATFSLPAGDHKNAFCTAHNIVALPEVGRPIGLYRIIGMPGSNELEIGGKTVYRLEHLMATLVDDVLFGYHEIGGNGITTPDVIRYILARQTVQRWQLGTCDFVDQFAYKFENTTLLSALLSLGEVLVGDYTWDFDVSTYPWTVHLRVADSTPGCGIHYMRNLRGIQKSWDATTHVTRLYLLGYGEGVNQLTVAGINGGLPYIDADTASTWGIKCSVYVDTRLEDPATLLARGRAVLEGLKNPYISYTASALDLARLTGQAWDTYIPGKMVLVDDSEHGIRFEARVVSVHKADMLGSPGDVELTIASAPRDVADSINTLADRMGINELYSQGATNQYSERYADNASPERPAYMRVYIPRGCVRINSMLLTWQLAAFRAYETGAAAGGGTSTTSNSAGGETTTSSSGGGSSTTSDASSKETVSISNYLSGYPTLAMTGTSNPALRTTGPSSTDETGGTEGTTSFVYLYTGMGGSGDTGMTIAYTEPVYGNTGYGGDGNSGSATGSTGSASTNSTGSASGSDTHSHTMLHTHGLNSHTHTGPFHSHSMTHSHTLYEHKHKGPSHHHVMDHDHTVNVHNHRMAHTHTLMEHNHSIGEHKHTIDHSHDMSHTHRVKTPDHAHTVTTQNHSHTLELNEHTHNIVYGIYEGGTASNVAIRVDGAIIPPGEVTGSELDIVKWLAKDADGKITRGTWHVVELVPDTLTRVEANLFVQTFVQSVGGGDY